MAGCLIHEYVVLRLGKKTHNHDIKRNLKPRVRFSFLLSFSVYHFRYNLQEFFFFERLT